MKFLIISLLVYAVHGWIIPDDLPDGIYDINITDDDDHSTAHVKRSKSWAFNPFVDFPKLEMYNYTRRVRPKKVKGWLPHWSCQPRDPQLAELDYAEARENLFKYCRQWKVPPMTAHIAVAKSGGVAVYTCNSKRKTKHCFEEEYRWAERNIFDPRCGHLIAARALINGHRMYGRGYAGQDICNKIWGPHARQHLVVHEHQIWVGETPDAKGKKKNQVTSFQQYAEQQATAQDPKLVEEVVVDQEEDLEEDQEEDQAVTLVKRGKEGSSKKTPQKVLEWAIERQEMREKELAKLQAWKKWFKMVQDQSFDEEKLAAEAYEIWQDQEELRLKITPDPEEYDPKYDLNLLDFSKSAWASKYPKDFIEELKKQYRSARKVKGKPPKDFKEEEQKILTDTESKLEAIKFEIRPKLEVKGRFGIKLNGTGTVDSQKSDVPEKLNNTKLDIPEKLNKTNAAGKNTTDGKNSTDYDAKKNYFEIKQKFELEKSRLEWAKKKMIQETKSKKELKEIKKLQEEQNKKEKKERKKEEEKKKKAEKEKKEKAEKKIKDEEKARKKAIKKAEKELKKKLDKEQEKKEWTKQDKKRNRQSREKVEKKAMRDELRRIELEIQKKKDKAENLTPSEGWNWPRKKN